MSHKAATADAIEAPQPCNSLWVNHFAILLVYALILYASIMDPTLVTENILLVPLLYALPITLYEVFILQVFRRSSVGLSSNQNRLSLGRVLAKYFGFCMILASIAILYWLLPVYREESYQRFFGLAQMTMPHILSFGLIYFLWMDCRLQEPKDEYWHTGMFFLGYWDSVNFDAVKSLARSWTVKAFFLPLMTHFLYTELSAFVNTMIVDWTMPRHYFLNGEWGSAIGNAWDQLVNGPFYVVYDQLIRLIFIADLIPACLGYALTVKIMDNHIRSADDSMKGWFFCLACYPPFWTMLFFSQYLPYMDSYNWSHWLGESQLRWLWATIIVISLVIYSSASVCFGTRWSNLTYRGLMCQGPYRICRHPAYFFKNLSWWMIGIPFIIEGTVEASLKQCLFTIGVNFMYYQRAVTEERHLSRYPEYRAYALWMNDHSYLWFLNRVFPFLKYRPEDYGFPHETASQLAAKTKPKKSKAKPTAS